MYPREPRFGLTMVAEFGGSQLEFFFFLNFLSMLLLAQELRSISQFIDWKCWYLK